ncbi:MAG: hypothetical protein HY554_12195 [Elusimicrobia bacterium]|nr:hypothetical protein [Elusimicrobiota bacterium]
MLQLSRPSSVLRACAAFALLAVLAPANGAALSGSKLGPHVLGDPGQPAVKALLDACPRVAKWLVGGGASSAQIAEYRRRCPGGTAVLRVYVPQSVKYRVSASPGAAAEDFWGRLSSHLGGFPPDLIDWLEGVNELDNVDDWYHNGAASAWFGAFWDRLADLMHDAGYHPLVGSIAVGNPALGGELLFGPEGAMGPLARVMKSKPYRIGWSYHAYSNAPYDGEDLRYWALRYRSIRDQNGLHGYPIVLTEGGVDGPNGGWRNRGISGEFYFQWLKELDARLKEDADVIGVTLFQVGQNADWAAFGLEPIAADLAAYIQGEPETGAIPRTPPRLPPPPAVSGAKLQATDGATFREQPLEVQASFIGYWGARGVDPERRWIQEHNMDLVDGAWREKQTAGVLQASNASCMDDPVPPPGGFRWTALCANECRSNADCPLGFGGQEGWCYGFPGNGRCLRLDVLQ